MPKIIVLQCYNEDGFSTDLIFVGNEFSRDPSDVLQLVQTQFKSGIVDEELVVDNSTDREDIIRVLNKNGYEEVQPKRICV